MNNQEVASGEQDLINTMREIIELVYQDKPDAIKLINAAARLTLAERQRCVEAVKAEEELPGAMPDENWIMAKRVNLETHLRVTVRLAKSNIIGRINNPGGKT